MSTRVYSVEPPAVARQPHEEAALRPLRVSLINSMPDWGGGERVFVELAAGLQEAGHSVTLVCRPGSVLSARAPRSVDLVRLRCSGYFDIVSLLRLWQLFRSAPFDAVLCNTGRDCFLAGLAAVPLQIPVVRIRQLERTGRSLPRLFIHRALLSAVVSVSHAAQAGLAPLGLAPERLVVIHNGIAVDPPVTDRADARRHFGVGEHEFVVVYTGRLAREKGADLLPEIATRLVEANVPARLLVAGAGPLREALIRECDQRRLGERVTLLGFLEQPQPLLIAADAAVMPSRSESFGVAAIEALANGAPLVASAVGGLAEIVTDNDSGLLVPADDGRMIAAALERVYREPGLAMHLRERGRARAREFSRDRMVAQYVALIRRMRGIGLHG